MAVKRRFIEVHFGISVRYRALYSPREQFLHLFSLFYRYKDPGAKFNMTAIVGDKPHLNMSTSKFIIYNRVIQYNVLFRTVT